MTFWAWRDQKLSAMWGKVTRVSFKKGKQRELNSAGLWLREMRFLNEGFMIFMWGCMCRWLLTPSW